MSLNTLPKATAQKIKFVDPFNILCDLAPYLRLLNADDRKLMELLLPGQISIRKAAIILHKNPGAISRKAASIRKRINAPVARVIVLAGAELSKTPLRIAKDYYITGKSVQFIARDLGISQDHVRRLIANIRDWANHYSRFRTPPNDIQYA